MIKWWDRTRCGFWSLRGATSETDRSWLQLTLARTSYFAILDRTWTHRNICNLTPKGQFENLIFGQVKWPELINDIGRSYCISFDASWRDKHNNTSPTALPRFCEELLAQMFSWPAMTSYVMTSYDLYGDRSVVALYSSLYPFESWRIARFIMKVEKQLKRSTTVNISIKWAMT